jgi:hypothetical protein
VRAIRPCVSYSRQVPAWPPCTTSGTRRVVVAPRGASILSSTSTRRRTAHKASTRLEALEALPARDLDPSELRDLVRAVAQDPECWAHLVGFDDDERVYASLHRDAHVDVWLLCRTPVNDRCVPSLLNLLAKLVRARKPARPSARTDRGAA